MRPHPVEQRAELNKAKGKEWRANNEERFREYMQRWRAEHPRRRRRLYGLTYDQYAAMLDAQGGRCAICGIPGEDAPMGTLCIDHDAMGVRGLLCAKCNTAVERVVDLPDWGARAVAYLGRRP